MIETPWMNVNETAAYMKRSPRTIKYLIAQGLLSSSFDGRRTVHVKDADAYLKACRQAATNRVGA